MTNVSFDILGRDKASKAFDNVGRAAERTEKKFGFLAARTGGLTAGIAAGFGKILPAMAAIASVQVFKGFIDEARESRKVGALTEQIIKSTGGAAKISAKQVGDLATAISNKTGVDDEAIQSGANLLLTFKNVRNEVGKGANIFDRATQAAVDLSAAGFGDVAGASKMLGKALNDPLKGLTALGKAGVTFTDDQKKQIKTLVETGKTLEAQKIILQEVESQVGGAAAAAADPMAKLGVIIGNVKETIGTAFLPIVDKAATWLGDNLPGAVATSGRFFKENLLPPLKDVSKFVTGTLIPGVGKIVTTFQGLGSRIVNAIGPVDVAGIGRGIIEDATGWAKGLITGFKTGLDKGDWKPLGKTIGEGLTTAIKNIGESAGKILDAIGGLLDKVDWGKLGGKVSNGFLGMIRSIDWGKVGGAISDALVMAVQKTKELSAKLGNAVKAFIDAVDWEKVGRDSTAAIGRFIAGVNWGQLAKSLGAAVLSGLKINVNIRQSLINAILDVLEGAYFAAGEWGKKKAEEWGPKLWQGLKNGIVSGAKGIGSWVKTNFIDPFVRWTKQALGIKSPSTVFAAIGRDIVAGLKGGVTGAARGIGSWAHSTLISPVAAPFAKAGTWLVQHGKNTVAGFKNGVRDTAVGVGRWMYERVAVPAVSAFSKAGSWLSRAGRDIVGGLTGGIATRMKGISGWIKSTVIDPIVGSVKSFFGIKSPSKVFAEIGGHLIGGLFKGMGTGVGGAIAKKVFGDMPGALRAIVGKGLISINNLPRKALDALGSAVGIGQPIGGPRGNESNVGVVRTLAAQYGWGSGAQWNALYNLIMGESGFRNTAQNPTSTAYGLFQFLDSTWGTVGASKTSDPWAQTIAGLKYIARSYGTPANAYSKWLSRSPHWYSNGGIIAEQVLGVGVRSGRKYSFGETGVERVTPGAGMPRPVSGGGTTVHVHINGQIVDPIGTAQQIEQLLTRLRNVKRGQLEFQ